MKKILLTIEGEKTILDFDQHFHNLLLINQSLNLGAVEHYQKLGLTFVDVPEIVGITGACENIDTLFRVNSRQNIPLFFTQTGQLSLEQSLQSKHGVYTIIHSGRDEEVEDERHLRQFRLTEEEFDCTFADMTTKNYDEEKMFETLLNHIQMAIRAMVKRVLKDNSTILKKRYKRNIKKLLPMLKKDFLRISYEEAVKLLNKNGFENLKFGDDLRRDHEQKIFRLLNKKDDEIPVFITHYPKEIKFFNMKVSSKDPRVVLSADLILPYAGEGAGSAVREEDFEKLDQRLKTSNMFKIHLQRGGKYEDFLWYLNIIRQKRTNPHAGYGIGNERVLQYIFAESDIRNVSLLSFLAKQTGDWEKNHREQLYLLLFDKKGILLSIGKTHNKRKLLPFIKKIANSHYLLCATEKTHTFLKKNGIITTLVHKINQAGEKPNLADLLKERLFDIIINIPTRKSHSSKEFTDGKFIRKMAVETGVTLITDIEVAQTMLEKLANLQNDS